MSPRWIVHSPGVTSAPLIHVGEGVTNLTLRKLKILNGGFPSLLQILSGFCVKKIAQISTVFLFQV
jgi:hypothetical protein